MNYFNEDEWPAIIDFLVSNLNKLEKAVKPFLGEIRQVLLESVKDLKEAGENQID